MLRGKKGNGSQAPQRHVTSLLERGGGLKTVRRVHTDVQMMQCAKSLAILGCLNVYI